MICSCTIVRALFIINRHFLTNKEYLTIIQQLCNCMKLIFVCVKYFYITAVLYSLTERPMQNICEISHFLFSSHFLSPFEKRTNKHTKQKHAQFGKIKQIFTLYLFYSALLSKNSHRALWVSDTVW